MDPWGLDLERGRGSLFRGEACELGTVLRVSAMSTKTNTEVQFSYDKPKIISPTL
jgi:hypothetical protein